MTEQSPSCFGKLWDPNNKECRGGNDPIYVNPRTGSNKRDMCQWYGSCSTTTNQNRLREATGGTPPLPHLPVVPSYVAQPVPQPVPQPVSQRPFQPVPQQYQQQYAAPQVVPSTPQQVPQQAMQHVAYAGQVPLTQPQYASAPILVPMNQPMMGAAIPSFLTVPEPDNPDVPMMTRFARTLFRSTCKAAAIGAANFIDYNPITPSPRK